MVRHIPSHTFPVYWYVKNFHCRRYLDIGGECLGSSLAVNHFDSCAEMYFSLCLSSGYLHSHNMMFDTISTVLARHKHRGQVRFIAGDPNTSLPRLAHNFLGEVSFDLALCNASVLSNPVETITQLAPLISCAGVIIISQCDQCQMNEVRAKLNSDGQDWSLLFVAVHKTGILYRSSDETVASALRMADITRLSREWQPIPCNRLLRALCTVVAYIGKLLDYCERLLQNLSFVPWYHWPISAWIIVKRRIDNYSTTE